MIMALFALALAQQASPGAILLDRNRVDRAPPPVERPAPAPKRAATIVTAEGTGAPISGIRFVGAKAPALVARAAAQFLGRPASRQNLVALAAALSTAYGKADVALYTVAIPQQSLAGGVVTVSLTEGRIAHVALKPKSKDKRGHPLLAARLARLTEEAPLSRATFERQTTLARAIPGLTFDTEMTDPAHDGALTMTAAPHQKRSKVTASFSNRGIDQLGGGEIDVNGELYGLATDGDQLTLAVGAATDLKSFRTVSGSYAAPLTASGLTATGSLGYLETRPRDYPVLGTAKQAGLSLSYPLRRDFTHSADVSLGVDGLDSDAAAFGNAIGREHSRAVRLAGSYAAATPRRSISVAGSLSQGLVVAGASAATDDTDLGFLKAAASTSIAQSIGKRLVLRLAASGQWSDDRLPAAERFAIGGAAIGRAFDTALLTGDRGGGGSAELAWRPLHKANLSGSELYGFADAGSVRVLGRGGLPTQDYSLASAGAGIRARYRQKAELGLEAAHALERPYPGSTDDWRVLVAWRLSI